MNALSLPLPLTSFVGRRAELAELRRLLSATRLLTLTGTAGSGKTRLALQLAHDLAVAAAYPDGLGWVDLVDVRDPARVPQAVASALAVDEQPGRSVVASLVDALRSTQTLLLLDNCEHLLPACVTLVDALLRGCPALTVLATSREALRMDGETVWQAPPLSLPPAAMPDARAEAGGVAAIAAYEAVQLFVARASVSLPSFRLTDENAPAVAEVCRRLDGLPLAIELAAGRVRFLSVADIAARLDHALPLLARGSANAPSHHQTLAAAIDWSYRLLSPREQALLNRLSVFAGGFTLEAAAQVAMAPSEGEGAPPSHPDAALDALADLVDKSLVVVTAHADESTAPTRYRLLETIRQYSQDKLDATGEGDLARDRHLLWCLALAEAAVPVLKGRDAPRWLVRLEAEHDNLRAALAWSEASNHWVEGLRLAAALHWFWERRGHFSEGRAWLERLLQMADGARAANAPAAEPSALLTQARADALLGAATLAFGQGDRVAAAVYAEASVTLFRELGDTAGLTLALLRLAFASGPASEAGQRLLAESLATSQTVHDEWVVAVVRYVVGQGAYFQGAYPAARPHLEVALVLLREVGDIMLLPRSLATLGGLDLAEGHTPRARARLEEALALVHATADPRATALVASGLGDVARCQGDYPRAEEAYQESLRLYRELGNQADLPAILHNLGYVALGRGEAETARALHVESLIAQRDQRNPAGIAEGLAGLAAVAVAQGQLERAARLFGAAEALREQCRPMLWPAERFEWQRHVAALRERLEPSALLAAWATGGALTVEQAVSYALQPEDAEAQAALGVAAVDQRSLRSTERAYYGGLTEREREVAALVAQGKSNRGIAEELVIAERTADRHVANILAKLGYQSRAQIAAWAVEKGLAKPE